MKKSFGLFFIDNQSHVGSEISVMFDFPDIHAINVFCLMENIRAKEDTEEMNISLGLYTESYSTVIKWYHEFQFDGIHMVINNIGGS